MNSIVDFHADDYALSENSDNDIISLCKTGFLDSISIIPNLKIFNSAVSKFFAAKNSFNKEILVSVHLNFMEGRCCAEKALLPNLVDSNGYFNISWGTLIEWNYNPIIRKKIKQQLKTEITSQIEKCTDSGICDKNALRVDSHQHTHMIPLVFEALADSLDDLKTKGFKAAYIRNTFDPLCFYNGKDLFSLNTIKCMILNFYSHKIRKYLNRKNLPLNYLCGVYYSGRMDFRIEKVIPVFAEKAKENSMNVELLFHPGTMLKDEITEEFTKVGFNEFHLSAGRKIEFEELKTILINYGNNDEIRRLSDL